MKILYFLAHPNSIGGAMKVLMTQAYIMQNKGHQVKVVIQNDEQDSHIPEYEQMCQKMKLEYMSEQYPIATCIEEIDICKCMDFFTDIKKIIVDYLPDIIHSVQLNVTVELVARELNIPHLMNIYPISEGMFQIEWLNIFPKYHSCDSIYFSSQWSSGLGIESRCIRVAYRQPNIFKQGSKEKFKKYQLINIATFSEYKRQLEIIKFIEYCKDQGLQLHINFLGNNEGDYGKKCKEYVRTHELENEVSFVGLVLNVEEYLSQAELMIHASTAESYPGVVVEAMANKVCVLATPVAGLPELLVDGKNGFLIEGYTYKDIYKGFECYRKCKANNEIEQIIENAYQTYLENHSYEQVGRQLEDYYKHIIKDYSNKKQCLLQKKDIQLIWKAFIDNLKTKQISERTMSKVWFLYYIDRIIRENQYKTALIWGAGRYAIEAIEWCSILKVDIMGVIDSYKQGKLSGYSIYRPFEFDVNNADIIFVSIGSVSGCEDVIGILEEQGRVRNRDYFLICNNPCISVNRDREGISLIDSFIKR